jgi:ribosomal protein L28
MARQCDICGRGSSKDASRSHSNIKTIKRQYVNLQVKKVEGGSVKVCTKCLKTADKYSAKTEKEVKAKKK